MAIGKTRRLSKRLRAFVCVLIATSLGSQFASGVSPADDRDKPVRLLALLSPSLTVHINPAGPRFEYAKRRTAVDTPSILIPVNRTTSDRGRLVTGIEHFCPYSFPTANLQTGRSPPLRISETSEASC